MKCQEGLIYDKHLRSCAIPGNDWECNIVNDEGNEYEFEQDETNVYGIDNLDVLQDEPETPKDEEFLEVIGENLDQSIARNDDGEEIQEESEPDEGGILETIDGPEARIDTSFDDESLESSGDGVAQEIVTQPTPTVRMITTQLQRLTQLMQHVQDKNNGVVDDEDITPEDLNSFLATQKVHSNSLEYQKTNFHSNDKTPMPSNGRINADILSDILDQQNQLNSEANHLTTLAMDATTQRYPQRRPTIYVNKEPITEIKMKSAQNLDGSGSHQIVVNRPEGSVLFNVPPSSDQSHQPYLSQDILKTILEISKQMVTQNHQKQSPQVSYAPQPFYYAVPVPYLSPQNNVQSSYSQDYRTNLTESPLQKKTSVQIIPSPSTTNLVEKIKEHLPEYVADYFKNRNPNKSYQDQPQYQYQMQSSQSSFQNPNFYYQNRPSYSHGFPSYQNYQPNNYEYPPKNQYAEPLNYQQFNYDGGYYERNRPFVIESSAPSYVEQPIRQQPIRKESYATYDEENLYDDLEADEPSMKPDKDELICSFVLQRQANKTDCYRYYVCNAKTKEVLTYTCPIFTAFNDQTKYCDALSYSACKKTKDRVSIFHNKKIIDEANKALEQVKMETQKVERIAQQVREETQKIYTRRNPYQDYQNSYEREQVPAAYYPTSFAQPQKAQRPPFVRQQPQPVTARPVVTFVNPKPKPIRKSSKTKRKKVKCRTLGNIVDPESSSSYWHCFKGPDGRMKRINKKCSQDFVFCPSSRYCSPEDRC